MRRSAPPDVRSPCGYGTTHASSDHTAAGDRSSGRADRHDPGVHAHAALGRSRNLDCGTTGNAGRYRHYSQSLRARPPALHPVLQLDGARRFRRFRAKLLLQGQRREPDCAAHADHPYAWVCGLESRADHLHSPRHSGGRSRKHLGRPRRHDVHHDRAGGAELLARTDPDDRARLATRYPADLRNRHVAAFRDAGHRACLHGDPGAHPPHPLRHDRGDGVRLHPHRARERALARPHHLQACAAQCRDPRGVDRRGAARLHARRFDRDRDRVCAARRRLSRLGEHREERLSRRAGGRTGACLDLYRADIVRRHPERAAGSEAARRMSISAVTPVAVPIPQASRVGRAGFAIGLVIVGMVIAAALLGNAIVSADPFTQDLNNRLIPPFWMDGTQAGHLLGTDQLCRDYLARLVYGARISLLIGIMTVITSGLIGITLGVLGGFFGGRVDDVVLFAITTRLSIPVVLVALAVVGLMGSGLGLVVATLGLLLWDRFAVVARATTMQVRNHDYVSAAWCAGASTPHILIREILPNIASHLAVVATLEIALAILLEAALSFLGLGAPPPLPSWGLMIAEGKDYMFFSPWVIMIPGAALFILVLGINLVGDGLRSLLGTERLR